ncbi:MAG: hypothetical protein JRE45_08445 [Deltaproteobacteria bacterium]|nr:hypothetical protein [Deltaproteobacteria bacterium]MBW2191605.1 hypothetical protein [Deltaproteobacteria bacterium]MBW2379464.1 hypothetical protein [Deltaproteobacteria bacterium]MBW2627634.1 hypothetical protein [Deltaproteobacteria bacterium]MBW2688161.1 hypothetical protein [Deltaproteobacteria bacterium]
MRKLFLISLFILVSALHLAAPPTSAAQQLKLDIKVFFGLGGTTYVSMLETGRERDTFAGWQIGFGPRLRRDKAFIEVLFSFNRWYFEGPNPDFGGSNTQVNSFELPFHVGYIPYKNPYFKWFLYAGYVNHFNAKIIVTREGEPSLRLRPKDDNLAVYQALARFGTSIDVVMFNLDLNYSISMNSATTTSYRTGYHQVQLNLAYVF